MKQKDAIYSAESPHPTDVHVGNQLRLRRKVLGLSQDALGRQVGVTFQQIQKYERGTNRTSASRLWEFAQALNVSEDYFFEALLDDEPSIDRQDIGNSKEIQQLINAYYAIPEGKVRDKMRQLLCTLADADSLKE